MKAAYIEQTGPPSKIKYGDLPEPLLTSKGILVRPTVLAVDPIDTYIRSGKFHVETEFPFIIGRDMVGEVLAVGNEVTKFKAGDRVWANNQGYAGRQGTFAELLAIDENYLYMLPPDTDDKQAVAVLHSALTAVVGLLSKAKLLAGEAVFINGGSGNVGTAVLQLAKFIGAQVAVTAGNEDKAAWCRQLGADMVIDYHREDIADKLKQFAPAGVDIYWDATKTPDFESALAVMAQRSRMLLISGLGHKSVLPVGDFYTRNCTLFGFTITDQTQEELADVSIHINQLLSKKALQARIAREVHLSDAALAHGIMETSDLFGKILVFPDKHH